VTLIERLGSREWHDEWDIVVIGGGATGLGTAVEAASRRLRTLLLERGDFSQGTSSRSTKLAHGGVRYLEQMNLTLVTDALRERGAMIRNAPHLVHARDFVVPLYRNLDVPYYGVGLKLYDWLSGKLSLGPSLLLSQSEVVSHLPTIKREGLKGGVLYRDGQFDDARYAIALVRTLEDLGGVALNYTQVQQLLVRNGKVEGVRAVECESGESFDVKAKVVINATGVFAEEIFRMDSTKTDLSLAISRGSHIVVSKEFLPGNAALMIPKTDDGRVLFAIPWHDHVLIGTTDEAVKQSEREPRASPAEESFLVEHVERYLGRKIMSGDVLSVWAGLRPLVRKGNMATSKLSRDHHILRSPSGLITVTGGKWTTYRKMGEDAVAAAAEAASLPAAKSTTLQLKLHGWTEQALTEPEAVYGSDLPQLHAISDNDPDLSSLIHAALPYRKREVIWAARREYARTTEDVLARRTRALFLNAAAAIEAAPEVSRILARELGRDEAWRSRDLESFLAIAKGYKFTV
jgi:glycerol-3-phosphate dehydrogenase